MLLIVGSETEILSPAPFRCSSAEFLHANKKTSELRPVSAAGEDINWFLKGRTAAEAEALPAWLRASPSEHDFSARQRAELSASGWLSASTTIIRSLDLLQRVPPGTGFPEGQHTGSGR